MTDRDKKLALHRVVEGRLQKVARRVGQVLPEGVVFAVVTFIPNPEGGRSYSGYVSNGHRADMIKALRECADVLEGKRDVGPGQPIPELH